MFSKRAIRRHYRSRVLAKAKRLTRRWHWQNHSLLKATESPEDSFTEDLAVRLADNLKACSLALQEQKHCLNYQEALDEVFCLMPLDLDLD
jgi:hypothetical protein